MLSKGNEWKRDARVKSSLVKHCTGKVRKGYVLHWHRRVMYSFAQAWYGYDMYRLGNAL